jgi:hypothetical protein
MAVQQRPRFNGRHLLFGQANSTRIKNKLPATPKHRMCFKNYSKTSTIMPYKTPCDCHCKQIAPLQRTVLPRMCSGRSFYTTLNYAQPMAPRIMSISYSDSDTSDWPLRSVVCEARMPCGSRKDKPRATERACCCTQRAPCHTVFAANMRFSSLL